MSSYVSAALRRLVIDRAAGICEYCLIDGADAYFGCEVEHIIAEQHGGLTEAENLALACLGCNRFKGTDIASLHNGKLCRLYNPRTDRWSHHFALDGNIIRSLTDIGYVTVRLLQMNNADQISDRRILRKLGSYPPPTAERILKR